MVVVRVIAQMHSHLFYILIFWVFAPIIAWDEMGIGLLSILIWRYIRLILHQHWWLIEKFFKLVFWVFGRAETTTITNCTWVSSSNLSVHANFIETVEDSKAIDEIVGGLDCIAVGMYVVKYYDSMGCQIGWKILHEAAQDQPDTVKDKQDLNEEPYSVFIVLG